MVVTTTFIQTALVLLVAPSYIVATQQLNRHSYDEFISSGKNGMIKFYQDWCGHCKRMKPDWDLLAKEAEPTNVKILDVNCGEQEKLCINVQGYPTIKYYLDGKEYDYTGGRSLEGLQDFVASTLSSKCDIGEGKTEFCSDKELKYIDKWLKDGGNKVKIEREVERLEVMRGGVDVAADLKRWMMQRIDILKRGLAKLGDGGEL